MKPKKGKRVKGASSSSASKSSSSSCSSGATAKKKKRKSDKERIKNRKDNKKKKRKANDKKQKAKKENAKTDKKGQVEQKDVAPSIRESPDEKSGPNTAVSSVTNIEDVLVWDRLALTRRDIATVDDGCELNDSMIDFFLRLIHRCLCPRTDVHVFSCHFFTRLMADGAADGEAGWQNVKTWTKQTVLFAHSYAVVPINSDSHWWFAVVRFRGNKGQIAPSVTWVDSLPGAEDRYGVALKYLRGYLRREWTERPARGRDSLVGGDMFTMSQSRDRDNLDVDLTGLEVGSMEEVPEQENGMDCGVFLLDNVLRLLAGGDRLLGCAGSSSLWCNQAHAARRREHLRRSLDRLAWATTCGGGQGGRSVSVPDLMMRRPELVAWLRDAWGLSGALQRAGTAEKATDFGSIDRARASCNGIWVYDESGLVPDRHGDLAGEIESGGLKGTNLGVFHPLFMLSPSRFKVVLDREFFVHIVDDRLIWDDGEIWRKLKEEEDDAVESSDTDSSVGKTKRRKIA